jgi:hypothetical protein
MGGAEIGDKNKQCAAGIGFLSLAVAVNISEEVRLSLKS